MTRIYDLRIYNLNISKEIILVTKILVVDDSAYVRQSVVDCFCSSKYAVSQRENAQDALNLLRAETDFSLLVLDVNMPGPSGLKLLKFIYEEKIAPNMHILMITTELSPDVKDTIKMYGVKGWITKPFKPQVLQAVVENLLIAKN